MLSTSRCFKKNPSYFKCLVKGLIPLTFIGMGINLVTNPKIKGLKTTNILDETKIKIDRNKIVKKIIEMFEKFFSEIETYSFQYYKNKANLLSIKPNNLI